MSVAVVSSSLYSLIETDFVSSVIYYAFRSDKDKPKQQQQHGTAAVCGGGFLKSGFSIHTLQYAGLKAELQQPPLGTAGVIHYTTLSRYSQPLDILYDVLVI